MVWLDCSLWADRSTVLVGPDGLTWLLSLGWQIHCPGWSWWSGLNALYGLTDPLSWLVLMVWLERSVWADWSTLPVGPDSPTWLLSLGWQIHCPIHCPGWLVLMMVWLDCSAWANRSTVLVGPDGLTWLLCMDWQIHCPGWSWWSDLTALHGLTDPLSWLVLMVWPDSGRTDKSCLWLTVAEDWNSIAQKLLFMIVQLYEINHTCEQWLKFKAMNFTLSLHDLFRSDLSCSLLFIG